MSRGDISLSSPVSVVERTDLELHEDRDEFQVYGEMNHEGGVLDFSWGASDDRYLRRMQG